MSAEATRGSGKPYTCQLCGDGAYEVFGVAFPGGLSVQACKDCAAVLEVVRASIVTGGR